jgi:hypothetical protein
MDRRLACRTIWGWTRSSVKESVMPSQPELDRENDKRFLTPLLLMALVIVGGILIYLMLGPPPVS